MSYIGVNPTKNIGRFLESKPKTSYPQSVNNEIHLLTFSKNGEAVPFGSYIYRIQKYPGDVDLVESFQECCDVDEVVAKFEKSLKRIVRNVQKKKSHYYSEVKAGLDLRYDINLGEIEYGRYYPNPDIIPYSNKLHQNGLLSNEELAIIHYIFNKDIYNGDDYDAIFNIYREHRILRWTADEVLKGKKVLSGKVIMTLNQALRFESPVKIDVISNINGRFIEVTNFLELAVKNGDQMTKINIDLEENHDIPRTLPIEIEKLYFSNYYYSPFKMIKRMYSLSRHNQDKDTLLKILPFLSSNTSLLYQIKSELDTIILILKKFQNPSPKAIFNQLDEMKNRIAAVVELDDDELVIINEYIDYINKNKDKKIKIELLGKLKKYITPIINDESISYLQSIGFNPPPHYLLPPKMTYAYITRSPDDNPENPIDVIEKMISI